MMTPDLYVSPWWQSQCIPSRWDVAGVEVFSISLWHLFALEQIGNAYVCGGIPDRDTASSMLLFCKTDMNGGRRLMLDPKYRYRETRQMYRSLRDVTWEELHAACDDYVKSCLRAPDHFDDPKSKPAKLAAPYQYHIVRCLCREYGMALVEAWNTTYALARCYYDAWQESQGDKTLATPIAQQMIDERATS